MKFKELSKKTVRDREIEISKYWKDIDLLHLSVEERDKANNYVFFDGPPTANGKPGIHHVISRTLKDATCRYKTMKGFRVKRKAGWDTHGLPVEIEAEKNLAFIIKKKLKNMEWKHSTRNVKTQYLLMKKNGEKCQIEWLFLPIWTILI